MIEAEFAALVEMVAPSAGAWEPTAEDLHHLFWGPDAVALAVRVARQRVDARPLVDVARPGDLDGPAAAQRVPSRAADACVPPTFIVQVKSAGQWYDIENWGGESEEAAAQHLRKVQAIQPHLTLRVHERD